MNWPGLTQQNKMADVDKQKIQKLLNWGVEENHTKHCILPQQQKKGYVVSVMIAHY